MEKEQTGPKQLMAAKAAFRENWPIFSDLVEDFPDFQLAPGLAEEEIGKLEENLGFELHPDLEKLFSCCASLSMNGLAIRADQLGTIRLPDSEALILGYLNLGNAADRLMMRPGDASLYYLEQHNGAITKIAENIDAFFNVVLPRRLYG